MLLKPDDLKVTVNGDTAMPVPAIDGMLVSVSSNSLAEFINQVHENETFCWITQGSMSMHHIVEALVHQCAPATLYFTTWAISEDAARSIFLMKEKKLITQVKGIIDHRVLSGHAAVYHFLRSFFDHLQLEACHAKMVLIIGSEISYAVYSSANMTTNNRIENTIVCRAENNCAALRQWFETKFYETHRRSAEDDRRVGDADDDAPSDSPGIGS